MMVTPYIFQSERIAFRSWHKSDIQKLHRINNDDEVMRFFPKKSSMDETAAFIDKMIEKFENEAYCYFAAELKDSREFIGFIGLSDQNFESNFTPCTDIGWRLDRSYWGIGLAQEGAKRCLQYAKENLMLNTIKSIAPVLNIPSINVMQKIGMEKEGEFIHPLLKDVSPELSHCVVYHLKL